MKKIIRLMSHVKWSDTFLLFVAWVLLLSALLVLQVHEEPVPTQKGKQQSQKPTLSKEYVVQNDPLLKQGTYGGLTSPSFEMRENVDFILTPALLVQECISEGTILTYPEE